MQRARFVLGGTVQDVGLRYHVRMEAEARRINGYVKNLSDGTVEIVCEGEKDHIGGFVDAVKNFEKPIAVKSIRSEYSECRREFATFRIAHEGLGDDEMEALPESQRLSRQMGVLINEVTKGFGAGSVYLRDIRSSQQKMLDKQDKMLDKQDKMLDKQDQTVSEIRHLSSNMSDMLDSRFQKLENEVTKIKAKLEI